MADLSGKTFGPYRITELLGEGGMAVVYKAYQVAMDRHVAFKVLPQDLAHEAEFVGRFQQEARLLAGLQHPHILPIFDFGERDGITYIVMPYIKTGTLQDRLQGQPLQIQRALRITTQVGEALDYAHSHGLIHRDVKPSNILLDERNNSLLTDFGIAKLFESTTGFTSTGGIIGTPAYMSPEQGQGEKVDHRTDVYSLGVVLYEMVTGRVPFDAETPIAVVLKHITDPLPPPRQINPQIPLLVERVILKATDKVPDHRFATAGAMVRALQNGDVETIVLHQPAQEATVVDAPSVPATADEPVWRRLADRVPRKWLAAGGILLLLFVLSAAAGAIGFWQTRSPNGNAQNTREGRTPAVTDRAEAVADIQVPTAPPTGTSDSPAAAGAPSSSRHDDDDALRIELNVSGAEAQTEAMQVRAGQRLRVELLDGSWSAGPPQAWPLVGPEGDAQVSGKASFPVPEAALMTLVAGVGEEAPFVVSPGQALTLPSDGMLWLGPNDDDTSDNSGALSLELVLEDVLEIAVEPSSTPRPTATSRPSRTPTITPTAPPLGPETIVLGRSAGELPIEAVRFGNGPNIVVFVGGIHAGFAPVTVTLAQNTIQHFTDNLDDVPASATVYVIRSMNPDSEYDPGYLPGRLNDNGVDLNRNWDCAWTQSPSIDDRVVSGAGGPEPFSEPETRAVSDFLIEQDARAVVFWEARAVPGIVMPGACGPTSEVSNPLAVSYARPTGYRWAVVENFSDIGVNGDASNWLDLQGIPSVFVLLPSFTDPAWDRDLPGILAVVREYGR